MMDDPYSTLGISRENSIEEIKTAFRKLAHAYHPDKPTGDETMFKKVSSAYTFLLKTHIQRPKSFSDNQMRNDNARFRNEPFYEYDAETGIWISYLDVDASGYVDRNSTYPQSPEEFAELVREKKASRIGRKPEPFNAAEDFKKKKGML